MDERNVLPQLPKGWVWTRLGDIVDGVEKTDPHTAPEIEFDYLDIASIDNTQQKVTSPKRYFGIDAPSRARQVVKSGDIIFSTVRTYLKNIASVPSVYDGQIASTGFCVIRPSDGINNTLIFLLTQTDGFLNPLNELQRGTSYPAVRDSDVFAQFVPLAPLPEQHRIVAKIEELFSDLDAGVAALRKTQAELKRYRQAVLKAAVEGKLTAEWRAANAGKVESAEKLLERIRAERVVGADGRPPQRNASLDASTVPALPEGWVWANVDQLAFVGTGGTPLRSKTAYYQNGKIPWVTSGALNNLFVDKADEFITELALKESKTKIFPRGSLLVALYGEGKTRGKVSELRIDAATNQACAALVFDGIALNCKPYVKIFFQKNYEDIRRLSSGGVQPNLNLTLIKQTRFPLPPLAEQQQIVAEVERRLSVADAVEKTVDASLKQAERLRQSILKRAFAGKLVPQDPSDEPAERLLERIRAEREKNDGARGQDKKRKRNENQDK
ncbi:MAG: restriction endonuclease subunit S [Chloroflexi bacterium]|nr:restriction endonuclease subunit S [Chloroflexota bacterium]